MTDKVTHVAAAARRVADETPEPGMTRTMLAARTTSEALGRLIADAALELYQTHGIAVPHNVNAVLNVVLPLMNRGLEQRGLELAHIHAVAHEPTETAH